MPFPLPLVICARSCSSKKRETSGNEADSVDSQDISNVAAERMPGRHGKLPLLSSMPCRCRPCHDY